MLPVQTRAEAAEAASHKLDTVRAIVDFYQTFSADEIKARAHRRLLIWAYHVPDWTPPTAPTQGLPNSRRNFLANKRLDVWKEVERQLQLHGGDLERAIGMVVGVQNGSCRPQPPAEAPTAVAELALVNRGMSINELNDLLRVCKPGYKSRQKLEAA